jgi:hypothetical protein
MTAIVNAFAEAGIPQSSVIAAIECFCEAN